jgi:hypothetical protein
MSALQPKNKRHAAGWMRLVDLRKIEMEKSLAEEDVDCRVCVVAGRDEWDGGLAAGSQGGIACDSGNDGRIAVAGGVSWGG